MQTLGSKIRFHRDVKGISQTRLAELVSVTRGAVSQWENDSTSPSHRNLQKIADVLGVPLSTLLDADGNNSKANFGIKNNRTPPIRETRIVKDGSSKVTFKNLDRGPLSGQNTSKTISQKYDELSDEDRKTVDKIIHSFWKK